MLCREVGRLLPEYADDALREAQTDEIAAHLRGCAACRQELASHEAALSALATVARQPAPDLWSQFQARLQQEQSAADCRQVTAQLPAYADGELALADDRLVRQHVAACGECAARERELTRPMRALQAVASGAEVDLWPALTGRLAAAVTCSEVDEALPAFLAGERDHRSIALQLHLGGCATCAASVEAYEAASGALARVVAAQPEVDLWPAFERRLQAERARQPMWTGLRAQLAAMGSWLRGPLLQPALGLAAFVLITVVSQRLPGLIERGVRTAQAPVLTAPTTSPQVASSTRVETPAAVEPTGPSVPATPALDAPGTTETVRLAATPALVKPAGTEAAVIERKDPSVPPVEAVAGVRVAFNLPPTHAELSPDNAFDVPSGSAGSACEQEGMAAVVQAVGLLAGSEDALHSPFETTTNEK